MDVVTIGEAKTHLSKLVRKAEAGEIVYLGAYGKPTAMIVAVPQKPQRKLGTLSHLSHLLDDDSFNEADHLIDDLFHESANQDFA